MVKKMVSKKKTSSSKQTTKKQVVSKHVIKKNITHNNSRKKPAIEKLNIAPVVIPVVQETPIAKQAPVQTTNITVEQPAEKIKIIPAAKFVESTTEIQDGPVREHDGSIIIKIFAIALCLIVVLFWIGLAIISIEYNSGPKLVTKNVSVTTYVYTPISLSKFMNITDIKYEERIIRKGFLYQEITGQDKIKKYIVDDKNNKIELIFRGISQGAQYDSLFTTGEKTRNPYNVSGIFRFEINRYIIDVDNITPEYKVINEVTVWRMENITTDDKKGVTFNIARGVNKIVKFVYV